MYQEVRGMVMKASIALLSLSLAMATFYLNGRWM